ncbi:MAG: YcgL domain-containing protein [Pseudomonadales bacterium]|nr:YcgL domain-containing protein [Pseudomonadales bacterium]MCP5319864.1 YcgL domain-containing protein [Pseudomonadales bacterium]MCP5337878.1 YcgL domain-containing protein [Pseudomonadales bacterium]
MKLICAVYRARRNSDTYIYVDHAEDTRRVPEALLRELGGIERAMTLVLTPARRLARTTGDEVMRAIAQSGYYLQLPPPPEGLQAPRQELPC